MSHPEIKLDVYRGESRVFVMTLVDRRTRAGIPLTGSTLTFTVRLTLEQPTPDIQIASGAQLVIDADQVANAGKFTLTLSTADTTLPIASYYWDLFKDDQIIVAPGEVPLFEVKRSARYGPV